MLFADHLVTTLFPLPSTRETAYAGVDESKLSSENLGNNDNSQWSPSYRRQHSVLSSTLWDRFVPTFLKNQDPKPLSTSNTDNKKGLSTNREAVSVPSGMSALDLTTSAESNLGFRKSPGAFNFTDDNEDSKWFSSFWSFHVR